MGILPDLFLTFARIGLFTFGGGYAMIALIEDACVEKKQWITHDEMMNVTVIAESTPGPIAVNMATFVGSAQAGLAGAACATLGVVLPALIVMLVIAAALKGFRENRYVRAAMAGIRPAVAGMIAATGLCAALRCALPGIAGGGFALDRKQLAVAALLCAGALAWKRLLKRAVSPILLILFAAVCGIVVYGL